MENVIRTIKIGYFADGEWAQRALQKMLKDTSLKVSFICLRYGKPDKILLDDAEKYGIPCFIEGNINSEKFMDKIRAYNVDLFVSMSFDQIFRRKIFDLPPMKTINCHAGKLPYYRGRNILNWALINDEKEFGITVHYVDEGIDTGDIILQNVYPITDEDTYGTLLDRAYEGCADTLYGAIKMLQEGKAQRMRQSSIDPVGMYCGSRKKGDEMIEWNQSSREVFNFVRALNGPDIKAAACLNGEKMSVEAVRMIPGAKTYKGIPGQILGKTQEGFYVKTADTFIEIWKYQFKGKIRVGDRFEK